ncbi:MAG: acetyl/propionyl-CoA carboxylase alpha subunit/acetyl-CoA carboxylase carboxyltransferase component [Candidatus Azotimanducaceae bacterium]|jgi:acetyl/propionyl-CoA carboxylase alpha subunit/acetyl-CoA carboxylase carboxyltransferase component
MTIKKLLIANRGEIAIRIARAAADLGIKTTGIYSEDDEQSLHCRSVDQAIPLSGRGAPAYLNIDAIVEIATNNSCDAIHPGYGFLSENAEFAKRAAAAGLTFVGPTPELLALFGDKGKARAAAVSAGIPVIKGTDSKTTLAEATTFFEDLGSNGAIMIKAIAGGGGRGTRAVTKKEDIAEAFARCESEAKNAFGRGDLYVEELIARARHIEVQIVADAAGNIIDLGERECSVQRRHQKIVEIAPAPNLSAALRDRIIEASLKLATAVDYRSLGTFEFLVDVNSKDRFAFIEVNARLQVEHTVTEEVTGVDLVQAQLEIAGGATLPALGLDCAPSSRGYAIQARVNMETIDADGTVRPASGTLTAYDAPSGPGIRTDGFGYAGFTPSTSFDSLLAKVIAHNPRPRFEDAINRTYRALAEFRLEGVSTNIPFLQTVLQHPDFSSGAIYTRWVDDKSAELSGASHTSRHMTAVVEDAASSGLAGAQVANSADPLAVFDYDKGRDDKISKAAVKIDLTGPDGSIGIPAPIQGTIIVVQVEVGDAVAAGTPLLVMEAMKMEHIISAEQDGFVRGIAAKAGDIIIEGHPLLYLENADIGDTGDIVSETIDLDEIRGDLQENIDRHAWTLDENRPKAVEKRRRTGQLTVRENVDNLIDEGTFVEYGALVLAAQRRRRSMEWLRENSPGDGVVMGIGHVNGEQFPDTESRCAVVAYDFTVLAGTQGMKNHYKQDRMFSVIERYRLPVVLFSEGGGGRPGDTDGGGGIGMDVETFTQWSKLSGLVPMVGVNSRYCFAGNTALLGCCDVIIATKNSIIGMGGPAMIEGGGLGIFAPDEVAPLDVQVPNGVIDIVVEDEAEAVEVAKKYLSYFQGPTKEWEAPDQRVMRHIVPENRKRMYDMRDIIDTLADVGSVLEIRKEFGIGMITAFIRVEGKPLGLIANNPHHLAGAIDSDGADKGARFLQLCDAFDMPIVSLMDCPGIMVGPEVEKTALVRHCCRMFNTGANLSVPMFGLIIRKAYGLGVQAMCGGSSMVPLFTSAWPTAEFAGMNIEGSIKLAYRNDFAAMEDAEERIADFTRKVDAAYDRAKAVNSAEFYGIDDVIDPADSRAMVVAGLRSLPPVLPRNGKKRPYIDTW